MKVELDFPIKGISGTIEIPLVLTFMQRDGKTYCKASMKSRKAIRVETTEKQDAARKSLSQSAQNYRENKEEWISRYREGIADGTIDGARFRTAYQWALHEIKANGSAVK